ncbi:hypothetical protein PLANPX_3160 [Lacipirellula parvula]|uniref:Uncharacterized protein n=1 Tax=Lacipirellula parvula TaxID=2650471 RepID=A0A5K7XAI0_9BACT|nr:hypothetical protein PLANPX_3160 [Lacipirellula parvula]
MWWWTKSASETPPTNDFWAKPLEGQEHGAHRRDVNAESSAACEANRESRGK